MKGDAYEGLLEKNAEDVKSGAGQYFTPRPLIRAIVEVMRPEPGMRICDPACGTGGFLLAAHECDRAARDLLDPDQKRHLRYDALRGWEIVDNTARLCVMNLLLHGIGAEDADSPIAVDDALKADPGERFEMVLTNPPFGQEVVDDVRERGGRGRARGPRRRARRLLGVDLEQAAQLRPARQDAARRSTAAPRWSCPTTCSSRAARARRCGASCSHECDVHTLLRLPTGIFYAQGVKANVLFFDRKPASRDAVDARALGLRPAHEPALHAASRTRCATSTSQDFVAAYTPEDRAEREESERFQRFTYDELLARDKVSLDLIWLRDESLEDMDNLPPPDVIAQEIVEDLEAALAEFSAVAESLGPDPQ